MIKRTLTGAVVLVFVYAWLFFSHIPLVLHIGTLLLGAFAIFEIMRLCKSGAPKNRYIASLISVLILIIPIPHYESWILLALPTALILFALLMKMMARIREFNVPLATAVSIAVLSLFKSIPTLRNLDNGFYYLTFAVTACFVTDIAALLFGKALGSHKLCPRISPQKTVEGAIGGLLCTVIIVMISAVLLQKHLGLRFEVVSLVIWAALVSVIGQFGDLCMSVVKRIAGVKDFGNLLPGHGGILDRFDSHMFAIAFTLVFCALGGGFIY